MNFGQAIEALKQGKKVARKGWNGKEMFLYYVPSASYPPSTDIAKEAFGGQDVPYGAYIAMKTAQGNIVPWLVSQTDMLVEDWEVIDGEKQDRTFTDYINDKLTINHGSIFGVYVKSTDSVLCRNREELQNLIDMLVAAKEEMKEKVSA
ncbi:hypothetical protein COM34_14085 [Bacillus wiedmannii]|nr:hypothetical protein CN672_13705 [Bacillus wiedmannii]PEM10319.1 hypothetical protein CN610_14125 [Bacillus wiedmannii]PGD08228.1 hypothetical protein COM34_14085 [Bacillus wiedmannii]PHD09569.1 hypothetical protein COF45_17900 [Bacillus wiedmannii]